MRTLLTLERLSKDGLLLEKRKQFSRSYTLEFIRILYAQCSQGGIGPSGSNFDLAAAPGYRPWQIGAEAQHFGIVVGEGIGVASPTDVQLWIPIRHGNAFKGTPVQPVNPGFETGDLTGWSVSGSPTVVAVTFNGSGGKYVCSIPTTAWDIHQSVDLTNAHEISFAWSLRTDGWGGLDHYIKLYVDSDLLYQGGGTSINTTYEGLGVAFLNYSGVHTVKLSTTFPPSVNWCYVDNVSISGKNLEYGGSEVLIPKFSGLVGHDGEFSLRRYFTNNCGHDVTVNEAGVVTYPGRLIIHDLVSPGILLADGELLKVTYTPTITV